jgi:hypothetical protein
MKRQAGRAVPLKPAILPGNASTSMIASFRNKGVGWEGRTSPGQAYVCGLSALKTLRMKRMLRRHRHPISFLRRSNDTHGSCISQLSGVNMSKLTDRPPSFALARDLLNAAALLSDGIGKIAMPVMTSAYIASMGRPSPTISFMLAVVIELGGRLGITLRFSCSRSWLHMEHGGLSGVTGTPGTLSALDNRSWYTVKCSFLSRTLARMRRERRSSGVT